MAKAKKTSDDRNIIDVDTEESEAKDAKLMVQNYIVKEVVADFSAVPQHARLTVLQKTPKQYIKERQVGGKTVHYVDHQYAKKCLNLIFNFRVSNEVLKEEYFEYDEKYKEKQKDGTYKDKERHVIEAECTVKFTFDGDNGKDIVRTVKSSHKGYKNPATNRGDVMQAAFSKAWTKVAATFGVGAELEDDFYKESKKDKNDDDVIDVEPEAPTKSFLTEELGY